MKQIVDYTGLDHKGLFKMNKIKHNININIQSYYINIIVYLIYEYVLNFNSDDKL